MNYFNIVKIILYIFICFISMGLINQDEKKHANGAIKKRIRLSTIFLISTIIGLYSLSYNKTFWWADNSNYYYYFKNGISVVDSEAMTIVFSLIRKFTNNFDVVLFIYSFVGTISILLAYRYSKNGRPIMLLFIFSTTYYIQFCQTALKQIVAISIVNFAMVLFENKKRIIALLMVPLACLFHFSAIIALPIMILFFVSNINNRTIKFITFLVAFSLPLLMNFYFSLIASLLSFVPSISIKISQYMSKGGGLISDSTGVIFIKYLPFYIITFLGFVYKKGNNRRLREYDSYLIISVFASFTLLLSFKSYWLSRMFPYFLVYLGELLSVIYDKYKYKISDIKKYSLSISINELMYLIVPCLSFIFTIRELVLYYPII